MVSRFERVENIVVKEEILVTSIFSFSHSVFKRLNLSGLLQYVFCGKELFSLDKAIGTQVS